MSEIHYQHQPVPTIDDFFTSLFIPITNSLTNDETEPTSINPNYLILQNDSLKHRKHKIQSEIALAKKNISDYEQALCESRSRIIEFAEFLKQERTKMSEMLVKWTKISPSARQLCDSILYGPHLRFETEMCQTMTRLAKKYPRYQIRRSENMGQAVDNALGVAEVSIEDVDMLHRELINTEAHLAKEEINEAQLLRRISEFSKQSMVLHGTI